MNSTQENQLKVAVEQALQKAEERWQGGGYILKTAICHEEDVQFANALDEKESSIPGHPYVSDDGIEVDEFIALVADMRDSSKHLESATSPKKSKVSDIQRVFYETSALLPAISMVVGFHGGSVTEYLGDGALALFKINSENRNETIYASRGAAVDIIETARNVVNAALYDKYQLPEIDVGVGLATSKAMVTLIGADHDSQPKAFGECVFRATKLSTGRNQIYTDKRLWEIWPTSKEGRLTFKHKRFGDLDGYRMM